MRTDDFDYSLPRSLIAQEPAERRESSRLMVLDRAARSIDHRRFADVVQLVRAGDVLVANRSKVMPARLRACKETGGAVELLLVRPIGPARWTALARPSRKLRPGMRLSIAGSPLRAVLEERRGDGDWEVRFEGPGDIQSQLARAGTVPLPPYIRNSTAPLDRYQTVYADREGSIAAPTAGLHFAPSLLDRIRERGVRVEFVTLHVGPGTFKPVTAERVSDHHMHAEWGEVSGEVAEAIESARRAGGRVVAVGTTTTRLLESATRDGEVRAFEGETDRFIYPGYRFQAIDALVTNFHLPRSTLLMLVSAFAGRDFVLAAYREAIERGYRFYSFGDAMLIL
ncbi:MAG: tRNA preQ1(34) S-adenosylmethionine ribosyltransferase-isomerase QueA [Chloroflexi bacterium]|nr:tRNA preQ1(34) S-adenosylmethionine ribosyltransferase-isomerase QueA [Chloroflexota bacterium]